MDKAKTILSLCRKDLIDIYEHVVDNIKPEKLVKKYLAFCDDSLIINKKNGQLSKTIRHEIDKANIHVVGGGKCVLGMATAIGSLACEAGLQSKFSHGSISLPLGLEVTLDDESRSMLDQIQVKCSFGSKNNLPDDKSIRATNHILNSINSAALADREQNSESLFIVLISGGGSACLSSPNHVTLEGKLDIIKRLVQRGADIKELNAVRRCLSNVKGGNLARHILRANPRSTIISLIISDVIGDPIEYIASGPTFMNFSNDVDLSNNMMDVLNKYGLQDSLIGIPDRGHELNNPILLNQLNNIILANNKTALHHASHRAEELGYEVKLLSEPLDGTTEEALTKLNEFCKAFVAPSDKKILFLAGGETTVRRRDGESWGIGGRLQEFCLDYLVSKLRCNDDENNVVDLMLAASTDGQDGPTDVAACFASKTEFDICVEAGESMSKLDIVDLVLFKKSHNSNILWSTYKPDWLVKTGATGTNVMDLFMYVEVR